MIRLSIGACLLFLQVAAIAQWDEAFPDSIFCETGEVTHMDRIYYGDSECQWFMYTRPEGVASDSILPLVIFSHGNGRPAHAESPREAACFFNAAGYAFISWESWTFQKSNGSSSVICPDFIRDNVSTPEYTERTHADFQRMLCYVKSNMADLAIDSTEVFVTGRSRGTKMSFKNLNTLPVDVDVSCTEPLAIKGVYLYQPFPDGEFNSPEDEDIFDYPNEDYPPLCMGFDFERGVYSNAHDAINAIPAIERYHCLGLSVTLREEICWENDYEPNAIDYFQSLRDSVFGQNYLVDHPLYSLTQPNQDEALTPCTFDQNAVRAPQNCQAVVTNGRVLFQCESSETWFTIDAVANGSWTAPNHVKCEIRGWYSKGPTVTDMHLENSLICEPMVKATNFTYGQMGTINEAGANFSFPPSGPGYDLCRFDLEPTGSGQIVAQMRCRISPQGVTYVNERKWWTPWSATMTTPYECAGESEFVQSEPDNSLSLSLNESEYFVSIRVYDLTGRHIGSYSNIDSYTLESILQVLPQGFYVLQRIGSEGYVDTMTIHR
jgi:hypothetical protein